MRSLINIPIILLASISVSLATAGAMSAKGPQPGDAEFPAKGAYVIVNNITDLTPIAEELDVIMGDQDRVDALRGVMLRIAWKWLEFEVNNGWNIGYLVDQVRAVHNTVRSDGSRWTMLIELNMTSHAPEWLYTDTGIFDFYYMDQFTDPGDNILKYQQASFPLPFDQIYLNEAKEFLTELRDQLVNALTDAEYDTVASIAFSPPGGVKDLFEPPLGKDDPDLEGADDSVRVSTRCPDIPIPYIHDYKEEWPTPCFVGSEENAYIPMPFDHTNDKLYVARQQVSDHFFHLFGDEKFITRMLKINEPDPDGNLTKQVRDVLANQVADNVLNYGSRYMLKINSLGSAVPPGRWDYENVLELHRVTNGSPICFEAIGGPNRMNVPHRDALIEGINRGAQCLVIYQVSVEDVLPDVQFVRDYYEGTDLSRPTRIQDLTASPGNQPGEIDLTWSAPADDETPDGPLGVVKAYVIRYAKGPIRSVSDWRQATKYKPDMIPARVGKQEKITISGLVPTHRYNVLVQAIDDAGKRSKPARIRVAAGE